MSDDDRHIDQERDMQRDGSNGRGRRPQWGQQNQPVPPDLEALIKRLQSGFGVLGGGKGSKPHKPKAVGFWIVLIAAIWAASGFYRVDEGQQGIELRLGKHVQTTGAGLHWHWPFPIAHAEFVSIDQIVNVPLQSRMLTADENIVIVDLVVQYRRNNAEKYLFSVVDPDRVVKEITESAIREVVGKNKLDYVLTGGLSEIGMQTRDLLQLTLDEYDTGIDVQSVNMQQAEFPAQVQAAVKDAIKAREDKEAAIFTAQAFTNDIVPRARGVAKREVELAKAYQERVIAQAEGEAKRFELLLVEYNRAPRVTRDRLYYETLESVYGNSKKVLVDGDDSGNLLYLPLDKLASATQSAPSGETTAAKTQNKEPTRSQRPQPANQPRTRSRR